MNIDHLVPLNLEQKIQDFIVLITPRLKENTYFSMMNTFDNYAEYMVTIKEFQETVCLAHTFIQVSVNGGIIFSWNKNKKECVVNDIQLTNQFFRVLK